MFRRDGNAHPTPESVPLCILNIDQVFRTRNTNDGTGDKHHRKGSSPSSIECTPNLNIAHNWIHTQVSLQFEGCAEEKASEPSIQNLEQTDCGMKLEIGLLRLRIGNRLGTNFFLSLTRS